MEILKASSFLCLIALFHHLLSHPYPTNAASPRSTYIIHVRLPTTVGASFDRQSWYKSFVTAVTSESHLLYSYTNVMSGFAARLTESELALMSLLPGPVVCKLVAGIAEKDLNYPSISVVLGGNGTNYVTVQRKVKNVGSAASSYMAMVAAPQGVEVRVTPSVLHFKTVGQEMEFQVEFSNVGGTGNGGYLKWVSSKYVVTSPISVTYHN
ncbi:hypothetical protein ZIOFF_001603 [Zingiber officinale]|uniref:Uncharacterized protein n=1 Tax=Zingiber officinale TaxID=94328 RepID=A0A8J5IA47_ZINOF|nr:hypothetical protein ZIOFF_001603 [Zingiber officinale]